MGKTYKDKANYYRFKSKQKEMPSWMEEKYKAMELKYKGHREGNNRKSSAKSKKLERRSRRNKEEPKTCVFNTDDCSVMPNNHGMK